MRTGARRARGTAREAAGRLARAGVPEPAASAEVLLSELLGVRRGELAFRDEPLTDEQAERYGTWISRRIDREPVQRILGHAYFRNLELESAEETLVPRPDTESVAEAALDLVDARGYPCRVVDLGTGSGAIAISIAQERPRCEVYATDVSEAALEVAGRNAERNGAEVHFYKSDVVSGLEALRGGVNLLVSNPPYVPSDEIPNLEPEVREWDPRGALDGGPDGLGFYRRIFAETPPLLRGGADVVLEVGDGQAGAVLEMGETAGFVPLGVREDLAGTTRAVLLGVARVKTVSPEEGAEVLRAGGVALVPTETVVGLVAAGAERLNEIKGSDPGKPVALLCASAEEAFALAADVPPLARTLASLYWPGPLTLVLDRRGGGTVGVRVPDHGVTRYLLGAYGGPLCATSANLSGEPAPQSIKQVDSRVLEAVDLLVEGEIGSGEASAVVDLSGGRTRLLRATEALTEAKLSRFAQG